MVEVISARSYPELGGQIYDFRMAEYLLKKIENIKLRHAEQKMANLQVREPKKNRPSHAATS